MNLRKKHLIYIALVLLAFNIQCSVKKDTIIINKETVSKQYKGEGFSSNVLYLVDNVETSANRIKEISANNIKSITVIKDKKEVIKYTDKDYEGVILITMKK
jgi:hypothetical protein